MEFLGTAASTQLLALMAIPLMAALIFAAIIAVTLSKRRKKSKMKLGTQAQTPAAVKASASEPANGPNTAPLSPASPSGDSVRQPDSNRPAQGPSSRDSSLDTPAHFPETDLCLDVLNKSGDSQTSTGVSLQSEEQEAGLRSGLGRQAAAGAAGPAEPVELLRLLRQPQSGRLIVEVAGRRYSKLADITDKRLGQYILKLAAHLLTFTNGMIATETGLKSVHNPKLGETPQPFGSPPASMPPPAGAEAALLTSLRTPPPLPELSPPRRGLFGRRPPGPKPTLPGLNLAEEINKIAQARLMNSPLAATTQLEITEDLAGGIRIVVNGKHYSSPDDIPAVEVKELIKASIRQWERS